MSNPRTYQTEAIIIKKIKLGDADRILSLYTPHLGKIRAVAKGVRRPRSKMAGHLELLTHSQVSLARGRNLERIIGSQTIDSFLPLKTDLRLSAYGLYIIELTDRFTAERDENQALFRLLLDTMGNLCRADDRELVLRHFELHLLEAVGYRPQLQHCVACHAGLGEEVSFFSSSAGGVLCSRCGRSQAFTGRLSAGALKALRFLQSSDYNTASRLKLAPELSRQMEEVTRGYFRYLLEREVKSAAWLDSLKEQMRELTTGIV